MFHRIQGVSDEQWLGESGGTLGLVITSHVLKRHPALRLEGADCDSSAGGPDFIFLETPSIERV